MRLLRTCHALAMPLWWLGFVGFAWYLLAPFQGEAGTGIVANMVRPFQRTAPGVVQQLLKEFIERAGGMSRLSLRSDVTQEQEMAAAIILHANKNSEGWLIWYYSPLNLHHWGVAMLCCAPALGMTFLVRHLTWRRQHQ